MVDLSTVAKSVANPATTHLLDKNCKPKVSEGTRVQFSFSLNSCGTIVKVVTDALTLFQSFNLPPACQFQVDGNTATYENEIFFPELISTSSSQRYISNCLTSYNCSAAGYQEVAFFFFFRLVVQCSYPVMRLHQLFSSMKFQSDTDGIGTIVRTEQKGNLWSSK